MQLSYARTIHTFQGSSAGPTLPGQQENAIKRLIFNPGTRDFELKNPGLFYSLMSKGTTLGKEGEQLSSAIYFDGINMNPARILNITKTKQGYDCKKVAMRKMWVEYQDSNSHGFHITEEQTDMLFRFFGANTATVQDILQKFRISK